MVIIIRFVMLPKVPNDEVLATQQTMPQNTTAGIKSPEHKLPSAHFLPLSLPH